MACVKSFLRLELYGWDFFGLWASRWEFSGSEVVLGERYPGECYSGVSCLGGSLTWGSFPLNTNFIWCMGKSYDGKCVRVATGVWSVSGWHISAYFRSAKILRSRYIMTHTWKNSIKLATLSIIGTIWIYLLLILYQFLQWRFYLVQETQPNEVVGL